MSVIYHIPALIIDAGIFVALYLILFLWYSKSYVNHYLITVSNDEITVLSGNVFRRRRTVPNVCTVYTERRVGVVSRFFGICTLRLHLVNRTVTLYGISCDTADTIEEGLR